MERALLFSLPTTGRTRNIPCKLPFTFFFTLLPPQFVRVVRMRARVRGRCIFLDEEQPSLGPPPPSPILPRYQRC